MTSAVVGGVLIPSVVAMIEADNSDSPRPPRTAGPKFFQLTLRDLLYLLIIAALVLGWWSAARRVETAAERPIPAQFGPCVIESNIGHGERFTAMEIRDGRVYGREPNGTFTIFSLGDYRWSITPTVQTTPEPDGTDDVQTATP